LVLVQTAHIRVDTEAQYVFILKVNCIKGEIAMDLQQGDTLADPPISRSKK